MNRWPNFLIVGAPKCGTTSLYFHLAQHPQVFMPRFKEPHFFTYVNADLPIGPGDDRPQRIKEVESYLALFKDARGESRLGEASPTYLPAPQAAANIKKYLGSDVKLIAMLRNPVDRAYSAWLHKVRNGYETLDFLDALEAGPSRLRSGWHHTWDYLAVSHYAENLARFYAIFGEDNVKVWLLDDLSRDPHAIVLATLSFLGLGWDPAIDLKPMNVGGLPRSQRLHNWLAKPPKIGSIVARATLPSSIRGRLVNRIAKANMNPPPKLENDHRERLLGEFEEDILGTQALIGRDLSHWLTDKATPSNEKA